MPRSTWTRKTYEMVAQVLNEEYERSDPDGRVAVMRIASDLARRFADDNPSFDLDQFLNAAKGWS